MSCAPPPAGLRLGSLFAGIGGLDLGFERAGFTTAFQVEIDPFCRHILAKHFPDAARFNDVREVGAANLPPCDVLAGGFPCQDISNAGKQAGIEGARSGLWSEFARLISELRPQYVVVENVAALINRGIDRVLADLCARRYDAQWGVLPAAALGAPHRRERLFIVAYPSGLRWHDELPPQLFQGELPKDLNGWESEHAAWSLTANRRAYLGIPASLRVDDGVSPGLERSLNGEPLNMDARAVAEARVKGCGNAVVPQVAEVIARAVNRLHSARLDVSDI